MAATAAASASIWPRCRPRRKRWCGLGRPVRAARIASGLALTRGPTQRPQPLRIGLAGDERREHGAPRLAHDVGEHRGELEVGVLEGLLDALDVAGLLAHELLSGAEQVAHRARPGVGHEARADQAVREQVGEPDRVGDVGLAAGHVLHVRGVGEDQGAARPGPPRRAPARPGASRCRWPPWRRRDSRAAPASPTGRGAPAWWSRRSRPRAGSTRRLRSGAPRRQRCPCARPVPRSGDREPPSRPPRSSRRRRRLPGDQSLNGALSGQQAGPRRKRGCFREPGSN